VFSSQIRSIASGPAESYVERFTLPEDFARDANKAQRYFEIETSKGVVPFSAGTVRSVAVWEGTATTRG
jgi:hypothetical protein